MDNMPNFKSFGTLRYSPKLLGEQKTSENWWLVLDCDKEIGMYYRKLHFFSCYEKLSSPAWDSHITVVRNEQPPHKQHWHKYDGKRVEFEYQHFTHTNGAYWWLDVNCQELLDIRVELGLPMNPEFPLHLSVGHS